jgi:glucosyl-dolichyl phosphate glucuronosyltransferase
VAVVRAEERGTERHEAYITASVVVCAFTLTRLTQTVGCVTQVLAQQPAPAEVIVVVDHNETLRSELRRRLPGEVTIVANQGEPGLSSARNTAIALSGCEVVVFIDDDAVPHRSWLAELLAAFDDPAVTAAGGPALPQWEDAPPGWFPEEFLWVVGCSYRGQATTGAVRNPLGCNMAVRTAAFRQVGLFDPSIGRLGTRPLGCEETEFCVRLVREWLGARVVLVAGAAVEHHVPRGRGTPRYLVRRCYYEGISKALVRRLGDVRALDTERAYVRRALAAAVAGSLRAVVTGPHRADALARAAAVMAGLAPATAGYLVGSVYYGMRPPAAHPPKLPDT